MSDDALVLVWDLWAWHDIRPSDAHMMAVRAMGLSAETKDRATTLQALMGRCLIPSSALDTTQHYRCAQCGRTYGTHPEAGCAHCGSNRFTSHGEQVQL